MVKQRADVLVHKQNLSESREKAKRLIMAGKIYTDEIKVSKPGDLYDKSTIFHIRGEADRFVSRGGYKLEQAIKKFNLDLDGKTCADFGASTGGFTDCMLQHGAKKVYAIDVGYGQLDWKIRSNRKVVTIERTNLRYLDNDLIKEKLDFISIDVSFISLTLILPKAFELLSSDGTIVALIKPQFEAQKKDVGKKGIVRDKKVKINSINKIIDFVIESDFNVANLTFSPIKGAGGNVEYLILIKKERSNFERNIVDDVVNTSELLAR